MRLRDTGTKTMQTNFGNVTIASPQIPLKEGKDLENYYPQSEKTMKSRAHEPEPDP